VYIRDIEKLLEDEKIERFLYYPSNSQNYDLKSEFKKNSRRCCWFSIESVMHTVIVSHSNSSNYDLESEFKKTLGDVVGSALNLYAQTCNRMT
jgi:hypothetical protein